MKLWAGIAIYVFLLVAMLSYGESRRDHPVEEVEYDYEEIGFCFWERYDNGGTVADMVKDVRFCIEVYPHSRP